MASVRVRAFQQTTPNQSQSMSEAKSVYIVDDQP